MILSGSSSDDLAELNAVFLRVLINEILFVTS